MRKLMWFSVGFLAACALGAYFLLGSLFIPGVALLVVSLLSLFLCKNPICKKAAWILLGCALGFLWFCAYDSSYLSLPHSVDGETLVTSVRATDYSFDTGYGLGVDGRIQLENRNYSVRVYLNEDLEISPGSVIHGEFLLRYTPPSGQKEPTYHRGQGIFLMAYEKGNSTIVPVAERNWQYTPVYLRYEILTFIDQVFSKDTAPFAKALLIGDTSDLDYPTQTHLMISGIRHVAAVSGLHVSILFSMIYLMSGKKRFLTAILGLPCLFLFAAVAGFTPSIMRACMMQGLMMLAMVFNREYDPPTALAFAVVTMLFVNPHCVTSVGFQLSVTSVAGIFLFASRIHNRILCIGSFSKVKPKSWKGRILWGISTSVSVSVSAAVFTAPLTALYFGCVSLISILTNLLCLWAVTLLFCGLVAACIIGAVFLPVAKILCWVLEWIIRYILGVSSVLAKLPLAAVFTDSMYIVIWLIFCYILLSAFLIMGNKRPAVLLCCAALGLSAALLASWAEPLMDNYRITALDVGQGQCVILQSGRKTYMVDCGGDREEDAADKAVAYLHSRGIFHLDGLILSHYDLDHVGGVPYFLNRISTEVLFLPGQPDHEIVSDIEAVHMGKTIIVQKDMSVSWDGGGIQIYADPGPDIKNESSLCVLFQTEKCDILITSDRSIAGEIKLLRSRALPDVEILVAGHHGAKDATGDLLLSVTKPEVVLISVSETNNFGHPSEEVLRRLKQHGCTIRRTDLEGTIIIRG